MQTEIAAEALLIIMYADGTRTSLDIHNDGRNGWLKNGLLDVGRTLRHGRQDFAA